MSESVWTEIWRWLQPFIGALSEQGCICSHFNYLPDMFVSPASSNTDEIIIVLQSRKSLNGGVLKQIVENATEEEDLKGDLLNNAFSS